MPQEVYPSYNGVASSWADIQTTYTTTGGAVIQMAAFSDLSFSDTVTVGEQRNAGPLVTQRSAGEVAQEGKAIFWRDGAEELMAALASEAPTRGNQKRISLVHFDIVAQHTPFGSSDIFEVRLKGCRILSRNFAFTQGPDPDKVECDLSPLQIAQFINGEEVVLL